jgi:hypothetical protein
MKYISPILSDARNTLGGSVASKNRAGNYFRARVAPVQPRSVAQQQVRALLATLAGQWKALTAAQIAGWNTLASGITLSDSLGNSYSPTGENLYVGNNVNLQQTGQTLISNPPAQRPDFADITPLTPAAAAGAATFTVETGAAAAPAGSVFLVEATAQMSAGISYIGTSTYRVIGHFAGSTYASINIKADYVARFGALVAGAKIAVRVSLVDTATGFQSTPATATTIVAA